LEKHGSRYRTYCRRMLQATAYLEKKMTLEVSVRLPLEGHYRAGSSEVLKRFAGLGLLIIAVAASSKKLAP
jgi:hypothetical protein